NREAGVAESARRSFGNPALVKEDLRDQWTFHAIETFWKDLRYAARMLRRSPGFTLVAIASLAIGIGANTAIFSVADAILLKSLPVREPEELRVVLSTGELPFSSHSGYHSETPSGIKVSSSFPYPMYQQFARSVSQFSDLMGFASNKVTIIAGAESHYAGVQFVTGNFFSGLGVTPLAGRTLTPEDDRASASPVAVISYRYWERHLGLQPEAVGRTIFINGRAVTIIGIAPRTFLGIEPGNAPDLFLQMALIGVFANKWYDLQAIDKAWVQIMGRLRPGASEKQAMAGLGAVMQRASLTSNKKMEQKGDPWRPFLENGAGGIQLLRNQSLGTIIVLSGVVGLVLLIACANLANLLLARGVARRREIAVRLSIGAGRRRLIRQLLTESLLLAGLGAGLGLTLAASLAKLVLSVVLGSEANLIDTHLGWRALLFTVAAALATALLFGLMPAVRATRVDLTPALKDGPGALGSSPQLRVSRFLIAGQVALSTLLLAGAGVFVRTLVNLWSVDPGFQAQQLLIFNVDGSRSGYQGDKLVGLYERIRERVAAIPGVRTATLSDIALISDSMSNSDLRIPGYKTKNGRTATAYDLHVGSRFLTNMGIRILLGRDLDGRDGPKAPRVAVVNETFARSYFAEQSAVGRIFYFGDGDGTEIVGVCKDAKYDKLKDETPPTVYLPYRQDPNGVSGMTFELRTALPPMAIAGAVQRAVAEIDRNVPVAAMRTQEEQIRASLGTERMLAQVVGSFGVIAALLAAIGLYGVMAYTVVRRTNEIGIRLALGAGRGNVQWIVIRESLWMVAAGLILGIPAALALTQVLREALYGIKPNDPLSFIAAGVLMLAVAAVAAWIPARRAARVDPMRALRCE
ncbi:MAG TPA: ABC transporter permease, partial [Bryobacteraceae bacterium]|nr:ABC transporter permease [Bryobacteraceae bacterium]